MLPACRSCNHYKHTLTVDEFRKYLECIPERLTRDSVAFNMGIRFGIVASIQKSVIFYFESITKKTDFDLKENFCCDRKPELF